MKNDERVNSLMPTAAHGRQTRPMILVAAAILGLLAWLGAYIPSLHAQAGDAGLAATLQTILAAHAPLPNEEQWIVADVRRHDDYAIASAYRSKARVSISSGGQIVLAYNDGERWQVRLAADDGYATLLAQIPGSLLNPGERAWVQGAGATVRAAGATALTGYSLPWPAGQRAHVTQNYAAHGTGQIDFWLLGDDVAAAKDGEIVYLIDSHTAHGCSIDFARYNNVVVIRHAAGEYTIYAHVAPGSVPAWIKDAYTARGVVPVTQGTRIARQGNTGYTCGGDGIHLHLSTTAAYNVWSAPDSQDEDGDGNRDELVQSAWGSPHQEVDFAEASYAALASWPFEILLTSQNEDRSCGLAETGGVALFSAAGCHGDTLALAEATALTNLPERGWNDRAVALAVTPGWSARVYEHIDGAGASRCIGATLPDLAGENFGDGATSMAGEISSLAVYRGSGCEPPPTIVEVVPAPDALSLAAGASHLVTVTLRTTSTLGVHFDTRSLRLATSPGTPLAGFAEERSFTDVALAANGKLEWGDELTVPVTAVASAWQQGFTTLLATLHYSGTDELGRSVTATATWPLDLAACGQAGEWNDDADHATPLTLNSPASGRLCPSGDRDLYAFDGSAGQAIWAAVEATPGTFDPTLSLYALDVLTPLITVDDSADSLNALLSYTLPATGPYVLAISAHEPALGDPTAPYTLTVSNGALALPPCIAAGHNEPDDTPAQARTIPVDGTALTGGRHAPGDRDWFAFSAVSGVPYVIEIGGKAASQASLFAADTITPLATITATAGITAAGVMTWTAPATGTHFVEVGGDDAGCTAVYTLRITAQDSAAPGIGLLIPGNGYTNMPSVQVTVVTSDTGSGVDGWRMAGTAAFAGVAWTTVPTQTGWTLMAGDGLKTLYAQVRDRRGNRSQVVTATIALDRVAPEVGLTHDEVIVGGPAVSLPLAPTADVAELRWRMTGSDWSDWLVPGSGYVVALPEKVGIFSIEIQVRDMAGNVSAIRTLAVTVLPPALFLPSVSAP